MSIATVVKELRERDWVIVPRSLESDTELHLEFCTAIFAHKIDDKQAPYLVIHSPPAVLGLLPIPAFVMQEAMTGEFYNNPKDGDTPISLRDILNTYEHELKRIGEGQPRLGVYMASGTRLNHTDLAIARNFLMHERYSLLGAELNRPVRVRISPTQGIIQFIDRLCDREIMQPYEIGTEYQLNLR
ncbi:hypothetical protein HYX00_03870 [Candidatus Woesearchaeota archaeon]|nr:hypothetical protein [Candidatus Woesearchaeota archaeon]